MDSDDLLANIRIIVADNSVFFSLLGSPVARSVVDAPDQEEGVGDEDGGHANQDHPQPLP